MSYEEAYELEQMLKTDTNVQQSFAQKLGVEKVYDGDAYVIKYYSIDKEEELEEEVEQEVEEIIADIKEPKKVSKK